MSKKKLNAILHVLLSILNTVIECAMLFQLHVKHFCKGSDAEIKYVYHFLTNSLKIIEIYTCEHRFKFVFAFVLCFMLIISGQ